MHSVDVFALSLFFLFVCCFVVLCMRVYVFRSRHELHCVEGCALYKLSYYYYYYYYDTRSMTQIGN